MSYFATMVWLALIVSGVSLHLLMTSLLSFMMVITDVLQSLRFLQSSFKIMSMAIMSYVSAVNEHMRVLIGMYELPYMCP